MLENFGVNGGLLLTQSINIIILGIWLIGGLLALLALRQRRLPPVATALWVALLILIPALGVAAFWIVNPKN